MYPSNDFHNNNDDERKDKRERKSTRETQENLLWLNGISNEALTGYCKAAKQYCSTASIGSAGSFQGNFDLI